jgi:hypothetical protein
MHLKMEAMGRAKKKVEKTKRKPAVLRLNFGPPDNDTPEIMEEGTENPFEIIVFNELIEAIDNTIDFPQDEIELFELKGSSVYVTLDRKYFPKVLISALKYFEKTENYEMCSKCQDLLQTIKI